MKVPIDGVHYLKDAYLLQMNGKPEIVSFRVQIGKLDMFLKAIGAIAVTIDDECQTLRENRYVVAQIILLGDPFI